MFESYYSREMPCTNTFASYPIRRFCRLFALGLFAFHAAAAQSAVPTAIDPATITNNAVWQDGRPITLPGLRPLPSAAQSSFLYRPTAEWTYSHHPSITHFRGRYYAVWSNGRVDEDAPGQRVLMSSSDDFVTWTTPKPVMAPPIGDDGLERVLTAGGFHQFAEGDQSTLVVYAGNYGPKKEGTYLQHITTSDGESFTPPAAVPLRINPNHPPQPTASGRLIISGNISFPYTDDPRGLSAWVMTGVFPAAMTASIKDDPWSFRPVARAAGWPAEVCEGSFLQAPDGAIRMLLRNAKKADYDHRLWLSQSLDDGATWSTPAPTNFSDIDAKFHLGRLPDGRYYYVGNPIGSNRSPLVLSISADGLNFDQHFIVSSDPYSRQKDGRAKRGQFGYPHTLVHSGSLHIIVSRQKEAIQVFRIPLADLAATVSPR